MLGELSILVDESGDKSIHAQYYLLTLVFHNQVHDVTSHIADYERALKDADLPNLAFHSEPLLNGHGSYKCLEISQRKKMLALFGTLVRHLPIKYKSFVYKRCDFNTPEKLFERMEFDIEKLLKENLEYFLSFDHVKIYYDNGQAIVKRALDEAASAVLSKQAIVKKRTMMTEYRLAQVADFLCSIELAAVKYSAKENGATYEKFFGSIGAFKKNWLKQARRKLIS